VAGTVKRVVKAGVLLGPLGRGEQQAAEHRDVLQEVDALRRALGRVGLVPERVPGDGLRKERRRSRIS